jgi:DNA-directed RNA polymerase subunit N (RpoN/RPB10)
MDPVTLPLPCFTCGKTLHPVWPESDYRNQVNDGVTFTSPGNYGSTVFDAMDRSRLVINVCDACLTALSVRTALSVPDRHPTPPPSLSRWVPPADEMEEDDD